MANNAFMDKRMTAAVGIFRPTNSAGGDYTTSDKGYHFTGRVTGLPYYANNGAQLLHLGAAYSYRTTTDTQMVLYAEDPEIANGLSSKYVQTNQTATGFEATHVNLFGGEVATVWNSLHAESEFMAAKADAVGGGSPCYKGAYAQAGYFLTGETRPYNRNDGIFDRLRPLKNFRNGGGWAPGRSRCGTRFWTWTRTGSARTAGQSRNLTFGLNWYLTPMIRIMWNYIHSMPNTVLTSEPADILAMRFQVDF